MAAMLARAMADLEREQYELRAEGSVMTSERGTPVVNPRKTVVQMHVGTILSMRRSLSLHARAQQGEARDAGKRRSEEHTSELQSLMRTSYAVLCLKRKKIKHTNNNLHTK